MKDIIKKIVFLFEISPFHLKHKLELYKISNPYTNIN
jgi:hypothetical protein